MTSSEESCNESPIDEVIAFMSHNHIDPDLAVEAFSLEPLPSAAGD